MSKATILLMQRAGLTDLYKAFQAQLAPEMREPGNPIYKFAEEIEKIVIEMCENTPSKYNRLTGEEKYQALLQGTIQLLEKVVALQEKGKNLSSEMSIFGSNWKVILDRVEDTVRKQIAFVTEVIRVKESK